MLKVAIMRKYQDKIAHISKERIANMCIFEKICCKMCKCVVR